MANVDQLYHAFDPSDWMFRHNIQVGRGRIVANSFARRTDPTFPAGVMSPYEAFTTERAKEDSFEKIRDKEFPGCPPRLGSIFLFPDRKTADVANQQWWGDQRIILPACILMTQRVGVFDSKKLDAREDDWDNSAREYWSGIRTQDPQLEVIVEGVIQLSGWEPYGHIGPPPSMP